jgi:hypothetical protein
VQIAVETQKDGSFLTSLHIAFLSVLIALPIFSGFDIFSASRFGVFLLINVICGQYIWSRLVQERKPEVFESLAAGLAIGTSLPALINIGLRLLNLRGFQTAYIFPTLCILFWIFFDRKRPILSITPVAEDDRDFRFIIATPFLAIVAWNPQAWPFCATYVLATYFFYQKHIGKRFTTLSSTQVFATPAALLISLIANIVYRLLFRDKPLWRYFLGTDAAWDEGAAWSVSQLGAKQNAMFAGEPLKGHIFTQAWAGDLAAAILSPEFLVTGIPGFALGAIGVALAVYATSFSLFTKRIMALTSLLILFVQASLPEEMLVFPAPRYANSMSAFYLFCAWYLILHSHFFKRSKYLYLFSILIFIVTLSKLHFGAILIATFTVFSTFKKTQESVIKKSLPALVATFVFVLVFFGFINGVSNTQETNLSLDIDFTISLALILIMRFYFVVFNRISDFTKTDLYSLLISHLGISFVITLITNGENSSIYFVYAGLLLSCIAFAPLVLETCSYRSRLIQSSIYLLLAGSSLGIFTSLLFLIIRYHDKGLGIRGYFISLIQDHIFTIQLLVVLIIAMLSTLLVGRKRHSGETHISKKPLTLAFVMILGVNIGNWLVLPFKTEITNMRYDIDSDSSLVLSVEQFEVGEWIASNTPADSLIASNFPCSSEQTDDASNTNFDCRNRNTLIWIAPLARRPVLLEAPSWIPSAPGANRLGKIIQYINYAERFANLAGSETALQLQEQGVTYFVIDKTKTTTTNWEPGANVVFENKSYFVLKLVDK